MPKSVDGDIRISITLDDTGVVKNTNKVHKSMSRVSRSLWKFGKDVSSAYSSASAQAEKYSQKLAKAEEEVKKQELAVQSLRDKLNALKNGEVMPQSLKKMDAEIAKALKEFDALVTKMDAAKEKVNSLDFGVDSAELRQAKAEYEDLAEQVAVAGGKLDAMQAKTEKLRLNPQTTTEGKKLSNDLTVAESKLERLKTTADFASEEFEQVKKATSDTNKEINETPNAMKKAQSAVKRFKQLIASAFIFNVFSKGLKALQESLTNTLKKNAQFSNSIAKIKGNLLTAFAPIYQAALPAINSLMNGLSSLTAKLATFIAALSGTTVQKAADAAENLYNQAEATEALTSATKEAEKSLASFDEINKIGNGKDSSKGIVPDFSGITDVDTSSAAAAGKKLAPVLEAFGDFAEKVAKAFKENIAPKLKDFGNALLGFLPDLENMDGEDIADVLEAIAIGIGAVFAIKIVSSAIAGISNLGGVLAAFATTITTHPLALAASLVTGLVLALKGYADYKYDGTELSKVVDFYNDVTESSKEALKAVDSFIDTADQEIASLDSKFKSIDIIADKYYELSQKANLTDTDKHQLKVYYDFLTGEGLDLTGKINDVTFAYQGTREELQGMQEDLMQLYYTQAAEGLLKESMRQLLELELQIDEQKKAVWELEDAYKEAKIAFNEKFNLPQMVMGPGSNLTNSLNDLFRDISKTLGFDDTSVALKNTEKSYKEAKDTLSDLEDKLVTLKEKQQSYNDMLSEYSRTYTDNTVELKKQLEQTEDSAEDVKDELNNIGKQEVSPDFSTMQSNIDTTYRKLCLMEKKLNDINGAKANTSVSGGTTLTVPMLAQGAVIPANKPFLSILGDQRNGTNVEAPLSTIKQAVAEVISAMNISGGQNEAALYIGEEKFGRLVYRLNKKESKRVGVNFSNA